MFKRGLNKIIFQITWVGRVILTKLGIKRRYKIDGVSIKLDYTHRLTDYQKYMRFYDRFLPHFIQYLPSKSTVVDIGANVGDTLVAMVSKKSDLEYVCIEADLKFYEDLVDNLLILKKQNQNLNVHTVNKFVGKEIDNVKLEVTKGSEVSSHGSPGGDIRSYTLESILFEIGINSNNLSLIKTDVDGYDYDVLSSAYGVISNNPALFFECFYDNQEQLNGYKNLFSDLKLKGYENFSFFDNYGQFICTVDGIEEVNDMLNYVARQKFYKGTKSFHFYDVLAFNNKNSDYIKKAIEDYKKKLEETA